MGSGARALVAALVIAVAMGACSQAAPPAPTADTGPVPTSSVLGATPAGTAEGHFNPTEAVAGGANASSSVGDVASVFATVAQASQLKITANASPPGATGPDVTSVSVVAQDGGGLLKSLDANGKKSLGEAILTAAGTAWPNAVISLLVADPAGGGGTIIGSHPKGGPNTVFAS
jgi:hypothetical protein